jgi:DNA-binding transcriptional LysR family regulator
MDPGSGAPLRVDLDLRKLRYFVAVAKRLHFGRAAERAFVSQPVLSRQVRKLEQELGVALLVRSSRQVELTDAGRVLLEEAQPLLAAAEVVSRRVREAANGMRTVTIGFFIGDPVGSLARALRDTQPDVNIEVIRIYWSDQREVLLDGRADVAFVHLPVDEDGLSLLHVGYEPRVALLSAAHPRAQQDRLSIKELADDPVVLHRGASMAWEAFHNSDPRPDGRRPRSGPLVSNIEEKVQQVAARRAISFLPLSAAEAIALPPGVVAIPVTDIPPTEVCLAWNAARASVLVDALVASAKELLAQGHHNSMLGRH